MPFSFYLSLYLSRVHMHSHRHNKKSSNNNKTHSLNKPHSVTAFTWEQSNRVKCQNASHKKWNQSVRWNSDFLDCTKTSVSVMTSFEVLHDSNFLPNTPSTKLIHLYSTLQLFLSFSKTFDPCYKHHENTTNLVATQLITSQITKLKQMELTKISSIPGIILASSMCMSSITAYH